MQFATVAHIWAAGAVSGLSGREVLIVPEPANIALIGSGLLAIGTVLKRRNKRPRS